MSTTTTQEDTNIIDEKKTKLDTDTISNTNKIDKKLKSFFTQYTISIIFTITIGIFIFGTTGLYTTKVAQSNILPDNINLAPYTNIERIVTPIPIDINIISDLFLTNKISQPAIFDSEQYLNSFKDSFLCLLKTNSKPTNGVFSNAMLYFTHVYESIIAKNFAAINTFFYYFSYLPEPLIMILYTIFGTFIWLGLYFFNLISTIFFHIIHIPQLFRNPSKNDPSIWEPNEEIGLGLIKLILFFIVWIPVSFFSTMITPGLFTLHGLIAPLFAKYTVQGNQKSNNFVDFIKDTFVYKSSLYMTLAAISLIYNGVKTLDKTALIPIIVGIVIAYFLGVFKQSIPQINEYTGFKSQLSNPDMNLPNVKKGSVMASPICPEIPKTINQSGGKKYKNKYNIKLV